MGFWQNIALQWTKANGREASVRILAHNESNSRKHGCVFIEGITSFALKDTMVFCGIVGNSTI